MEIKAVLFDLDGTLTDTLPDLYESVNYALERCGIPAASYEKVRMSIGNGASMLMQRVTEGFPEMRVEAEELFREHYRENGALNAKKFDGVNELLQILGEIGVKRVIVSNKMNDSVKIIAEKVFGRDIDFAVGSDESIKIKPAPDGCDFALKHLGFERGNALYVGDSDVDVMTAHAIGVKCVGAAYGYRGREHLKSSGCDYIADSVQQLKSVILALIKESRR